MRVTVFSCIRNNRSLDRYAIGLAQGFPPNVEVQRIWFERSRSAIGWMRDHLRYLGIARQQKADINIIVSVGYSFLLRAVDPRRTLIVCHDLHPLLDPEINRLRHRIYAERFRRQVRLAQRAAWLVTVSEHTRQDLLRLFPAFSPEKVVAIHNGLDATWKRVNDERALEDFRRRNGLGGRRIVLHVGNDVWYKNLPTLLHAFAQFGSPHHALVHAGSLAPQTQVLAAQLGLADRFIQIGSADDDTLAALYSLAEVFVFPSLSEGFGWPPLEAMACGCPVIASSRASIPEVLGDACLFVDPTDPAAIANAIHRVTSDSALCADLVQRGMQRPPLFSWEATAAKMLKLFSN